MIVLKIILWIVVLILVLLAVVLLLPIGIDLVLSDGEPAKTSLRVAGIKFSLGSKNKSDTKKSETKTSSNSKDFITRLRSAAALIKSAVGRLPWLVKKCKVRKLVISFTAADSDAADAALIYGLACAVIYPFADWIAQTYHLSDRRLKTTVNCDFDAEKPKYHLCLVADAHVFHLAAYALYILLHSNREDASNAK